MSATTAEGSNQAPTATTKPATKTTTTKTATTTKAAEEPPLPAPRLSLGHGAVLRAIEKNTVKVVVPAVGQLRLPSVDTLAWLGGLAALAAVGVLDWPVAAAIGAGHVLAQQRHLRLLKDFGEGLEEA